jgi:anti-sigma B factor antagonist
MSANGDNGKQGLQSVVDRGEAPQAGPEKTEPPAWDADVAPRPRVQTVERVAIVRLTPCQFLLGETAVRELLGRLERLVEAEGHTQILLNLRGVRYVSGEVLQALAGFRKRFGRRRGDVRLCGLDPLVLDLLRVSRLDQVFEVCTDEPEALGILAR